MKTRTKETLSDKIADILNTAPASFDPEDDAVDATNAKLSLVNEEEQDEKEEEILSKFRRQNIDLLGDVDQKYAGKKVSRRSIRDSSSDDTSLDEAESSLDEVEPSETDEEKDEGVEESESANSDENEESEDESEEEESGSGESIPDLDNDENLDDTSFKHISDTNVSNQIKKGICVRNQMSMWENLLEMRIQLQKCLAAANKLPQNETLSQLKQESDYSNQVSKTKSNVCGALEKLLLFQKLVQKQYPETKNLGQETAQEMNEDEEIPSDTEDEKSDVNDEKDEETPKKKRKLQQYEHEISDHHSKYKNYRNGVIQKWNDKTRVVVKGGATSHSVLDQIDYNLSNKDKLLKRTQLKRSQYKILGQEDAEEDKTSEEYNAEIFDDDDFYHQLLRELIEVKSADVTDPVQLGRQWIQLQSLRSKMKRKIDTKATKGRKIRYAVHSKLVNFMAPIDENLWTDEAKNELYSSLFGNKSAGI